MLKLLEQYRFLIQMKNENLNKHKIERLDKKMMGFSHIKNRRLGKYDYWDIYKNSDAQRMKKHKKSAKQIFFFFHKKNTRKQTTADLH